MFKRLFGKSAPRTRLAEVQALNLQDKPFTLSLLTITAEIMDDTDQWFKDALGKEADKRVDRSLSERTEDACCVFALSMYEKATQYLERKAILPGDAIPADFPAELAYAAILGLNVCSFVQNEQVSANQDQVASNIIRSKMIMQPEEVTQRVGNRALQFVRMISTAEEPNAVDWRSTTHQLVGTHIKARHANVLGEFADKIPSLYGSQLRGLLNAIE